MITRTPQEVTAMWLASKNPGDPRHAAAIAWMVAWESQDAVALQIAEAKLRQVQR